MADAEHWRRRIAEVDGKKADDRDVAARRAAYLEERRSALVSQATSDLEAFLQSEEAKLIKEELGNIDRRAVQRAYEQACAGSGTVRFPTNILVSSSRPIPHHRLSRTFAFTEMGLTEFYPAYNLFGIPVPAGRSIEGNCLKTRGVSTLAFAQAFVESIFPEGVQIRVSEDNYVPANDAKWNGISFDEWKKRLGADGPSGVVERIRISFDVHLKGR
jgi:hypothetical protein